jgi:MFS family permease
MSLPYLVFFLTNAHYSAIKIGTIISAQWIAFGIGGLSLSFLGDRIGKKNAMMLSLILTALLSFAMAYCDSFSGFAIVSFLIGLSRSIFTSAMPAYLTDKTPEKLQRFTFNIQFIIVNLAGSTGPLLGVYYADQHSMLLFKISAAIFLIAAIAMQFLLPKDTSTQEKLHPRIKFSDSMKVLKQSKKMFMLFVAVAIFQLVYGQLEAPIAQVLEVRTPHLATWLFGAMWVINTMMIVTLQLPLIFITKNTRLLTVCTLGILLVTMSFLILAFYPSASAFLISIAVLTFGEMLVSPLGNIIVAKIAPQHLRSSYFGVLTFASIGGGLSALIGSIFIQYANSEILFIFMAILTFTSLWFYQQSLKT